MSQQNKVTNLDYLSELAKGDTIFIREMISIFLEENPQEINSLEAAIEEVQFENIRSLSHHMKSTIAFVGIDLLIGKDLMDIEKLASEKTGIDTIRTLFVNVKTICGKAFNELNP